LVPDILEDQSRAL